jgi:PAS domain S-box-containing protein
VIDRRTEDDELRTRLRQQAAVADLGRRALAGMGLEELLSEAASVVAEELAVPFVTISEPTPDDEGLIVRANVGLPEDLAALPYLPSDVTGQTTFTLRKGEAVVVGDLTAERRFTPSPRLLELGALSTASVPIGVHGRPFGVLAASSRRADDFSENDVNFLQGMANTLAAALERERGERELRVEHDRLEEALTQASESEARFRELADSAPVFIWTADPDGLVDFINRGWLDFTGREAHEELGDSWGVGVHPDDEEAVTSTWWRAFRRRVPWEREYRLRREDGEYRWIVDRGVPRFGPDGELIGYVGTATDIHERKEMEEKLSVALARDHEVAETLQRSLLPESLPHIDGIHIEARYLPAEKGSAIGGDWYDALELEDGRVAVVVGDVVGHGLRAATVMGQLRNAFRAYALVESSPAAILVRLNRLLMTEGRDLMATALALVLDRDTGHVRYSSAGHPPALVIAGEGPHYLEGGRSVPLGTADPVAYGEGETTIEPGSVLLLYTDGLVERRDTPLDDRLAQLATVAEVADGELSDVCDQILGGVLGGRRPADDVCLLAVRPDTTTAGNLSLRLPADPAALSQLRRRLGRFLTAAGASDEERFEIILTVSEAAMNAIEHAYGPGDAEFELSARVSGGELSVAVSDTGAWRERRGTDRGRGLKIMDGLMDAVEVDSTPAGTTVRMTRRLRTRTAVA